jgi:hypothetical protein
MIRQGTPIQSYQVSGRTVYVKREDLCCDEARFSKLRGVAARIQSRSEHTIGVLDTRHSKAGWGVSYLCRELGRQAVVFYPSFKHERGLKLSQREAKRCGAILQPIPAGRSCILYHRAREILRTSFPDSYLLPNALKLQESVDETATELMKHTPFDHMNPHALWVVSISSGTIGAGVIKGLTAIGSRCAVVLHMGYSRPEVPLRKYVEEAAGGLGDLQLMVVDEGYGYADAVVWQAPFPCNPYYDLKAWRWLVQNINQFPHADPIVFWNIGE